MPRKDPSSHSREESAKSRFGSNYGENEMSTEFGNGLTSGRGLASDVDGPASLITPGDVAVNGNTSISVRSLWKVYGQNPERVLEPENAGREKNEILSEMGCVPVDPNVIISRCSTYSRLAHAQVPLWPAT